MACAAFRFATACLKYDSFSFDADKSASFAELRRVTTRIRCPRTAREPSLRDWSHNSIARLDDLQFVAGRCGAQKSSSSRALSFCNVSDGLMSIHTGEA